MKIGFNRPPYVGTELKYIEDAVREKKISGDGKYTGLCSEWLEEKTQAVKALLTTSCTHALEMAAMLCGIQPGDEVIMPSYTFCSTANAFVLRGAKIVFVDIRPDTMNIDEKLIEGAITSRTKAIVPVHYAGMSCEMDTIMQIACEHGIAVVEDAAQGIMSTYKGKYLGGISDIGCYSFHETKNYSMGEGGAILLNDERYIDEAEIIREKGTNRSKFFRGQIDKYTWIMEGSSYLPSDINAAYLYAQLEIAEDILADRMRTWEYYQRELQGLEERDMIELPRIPTGCTHNAHMFWVKFRDLPMRTRFIEYAADRGVNAVYHYIPLHSSPAGRMYGEFYQQDVYTTRESERLVRLPLYYGMEDSERHTVVEVVQDFVKTEMM